MPTNGTAPPSSVDSMARNSGPVCRYTSTKLNPVLIGMTLLHLAHGTDTAWNVWTCLDAGVFIFEACNDPPTCDFLEPQLDNTFAPNKPLNL
jgi:hypothetical protein